MVENHALAHHDSGPGQEKWPIVCVLRKMTNCVFWLVARCKWCKNVRPKNEKYDENAVADDYGCGGGVEEEEEDDEDGEEEAHWKTKEWNDAGDDDDVG